MQIRPPVTRAPARSLAVFGPAPIAPPDRDALKTTAQATNRRGTVILLWLGPIVWHQARSLQDFSHLHRLRLPMTWSAQYTKKKSQCSLLSGTKAYQTRLCSCTTFSCFSNRTPPLFQDEVTPRAASYLLSRDIVLLSCDLLRPTVSVKGVSCPHSSLVNRSSGRTDVHDKAVSQSPHSRLQMISSVNGRNHAHLLRC